MPTVAVIYTRDSYDEHDDNYHVSIEPLLEWVDVTQEELDLIYKNRYQFKLEMNYYMVIIVKPDPDISKKFPTVNHIVEKARAIQKENDIEVAKKKALAEKKKAEAALKKQAKTEADEKLLLETLKQKYGE